MEIPKQVQDKLAQFQGIQNQMQMMALQKQQLILQSTDLDNALAEVGNATGKEKIYKMAGPLLIETNKDESMKNLQEKKELADTRIKVLEKQEKKIGEKFEGLRGELQMMLQGKGGGNLGSGNAGVGG